MGQHLLREAEARGFTASGTRHGTPAPGLADVDLTDPLQVRGAVRTAGPDAVLIVAAMTSVDGCEADPVRAKKVNEEAPFQIATECRERGAACVYFSTDYVFDGTVAPVGEDVPPSPLNVYGRTKAGGERNVRTSHPSPLIIRTSANFGWDRLQDRDNSVVWALRRLRRGETVPLFVDQSVSPSCAPDVARITFDLLEADRSGTFHVAVPECLTRMDMGRAICGVFRLPEALLSPARLEDAGLRARRPMKSCLSVEKVERTLHVRMRTFRECLVEMRDSE